MKKFFLAFALLLSIGAGCLPVANRVVEGKWQLAFNLPNGYVMVKVYNSDSKQPLDYDIKRDDSSVMIQSTDKKLCYSSGRACEDVTAVTPDGDDMQITVTKLDARRILPEEREDMGNGFSKVKFCEDNEDCRLGGAGNYEYFLETEGGNYKFEYRGDTSTAEKIIKSAKPVTKFTDGVEVDVETE